MHTMREHPGWTTTAARPVRTAAGAAIARAEGSTITVQTPDPEAAPKVDVYDPKVLTDRVPPQLRTVLGQRGPVARLRNPDLWDAIATAIIRQVIRADQARLMYQRFSAAFGETITTASGERLHLLPDPQTTLELGDGDFAELRMTFKRRPLRAAAEAVVEFGEKWQMLSPARLAEELQTVPRIGPWTAGATVADYTGDFSHYPYGDMAVRKYARQAAPALNLPDTEPEFAARWEGYTTTHRELSALTVLTLALGGPRGEAHPPTRACIEFGYSHSLIVAMWTVASYRTASLS